MVFFYQVKIIAKNGSTKTIIIIILGRFRKITIVLIVYPAWAHRIQVNENCADKRPYFLIFRTLLFWKRPAGYTFCMSGVERTMYFFYNQSKGLQTNERHTGNLYFWRNKLIGRQKIRTSKFFVWLQCILVKDSVVSLIQCFDSFFLTSNIFKKPQIYLYKFWSGPQTDVPPFLLFTREKKTTTQVERSK